MGCRQGIPRLGSARPHRPTREPFFWKWGYGGRRESSVLGLFCHPGGCPHATLEFYGLGGFFFVFKTQTLFSFAKPLDICKGSVIPKEPLVPTAVHGALATGAHTQDTAAWPPWAAGCVHGARTRAGTRAGRLARRATHTMEAQLSMWSLAPHAQGGHQRSFYLW